MRADTQRLPKLDAQQLKVLLNGKDIVGSPSAVGVRPAYTTWVFGSSPAGNRCRLSEGGAVVDITQIKDKAELIGVTGTEVALLTVHSDDFWRSLLGG